MWYSRILHDVTMTLNQCNENVARDDILLNDYVNTTSRLGKVDEIERIHIKVNWWIITREWNKMIFKIIKRDDIKKIK